jgi:hypothetical protein
MGRKEEVMHRLRLLLLLPLTLALALIPTAASAAPPEIEHFRDVGTFTDTDFCGTGQTVEGTFDIRGTEWISPDGPEDLVRVTHSGTITLTNPDTGLSVTSSFAGQVTETLISGDPEGVHTVLTTNKGLPEIIRAVNGPVLLREAGVITWIATFDGDEFLGLEIVTVHGPHPEAESDFTLFCEVTTAALGIE